MTKVREQVDALIDAHLEARSEYKAQRYRVTMAELSGQPEPAMITEIEESLTRVYELLYSNSERIAAISVALEFNGEG